MWREGRAAINAPGVQVSSRSSEVDRSQQMMDRAGSEEALTSAAGQLDAFIGRLARQPRTSL